MSRRWLCPLAVVLVASGARAAEPPAPKELAARIDGLVAARWAANKVRPAAPSADAEFLRRVSLDLVGRIPSSAEVYAFYDDKSPDKRERLVERLLDSPAHAAHMANAWRAMMLPRNNNPQVEVVIPQLEQWLRQAFRDNVRYDRLVRDVITAGVAAEPPVPGAAPKPTPIAFYQANEMKAENLAAATSRVFLGVKIECAQCHNHPFAEWKQEQFWEFAAFFAGITPRELQDGVFSPAKDDPAVRTIAAPKGKTATAKFLGGGEPVWAANVATRAVLARWVTAPDNPYFAAATANKVWAQFFGTGLIDPLDEPEANPPSHPDVLKALADAFVASGYDLRYLFRTITATRVYGLTSARTDASQDTPRAFARAAPRGLSPEQLFDSLALATGFADTTPPRQRGVPGVRTPRNDFLAKFANQSERRTEPEVSVVQALALMNGPFVGDATGVESSRTLAAVATAPTLTAAERIEALFVATLSRKPRPEEAAKYLKYVERGGPSGDQKLALADVFWVLLNSAEFCLNH